MWRQRPPHSREETEDTCPELTCRLLPPPPGSPMGLAWLAQGRWAEEVGGWGEGWTDAAHAAASVGRWVCPASLTGHYWHPERLQMEGALGTPDLGPLPPYAPPPPQPGAESVQGGQRHFLSWRRPEHGPVSAGPGLSEQPRRRAVRSACIPSLSLLVRLSRGPAPALQLGLGDQSRAQETQCCVCTGSEPPPPLDWQPQSHLLLLS